MPGLDGKGPTGEGRPGRGLGRCGSQRSDVQPRPQIKGETYTNMDRGAGNGGGRGGRRRRGTCRRRNGTNFNVQLDEAI